MGTKASDYISTVKHHLEYEMGIQMHSVDGHDIEDSGCGEPVGITPPPKPMGEDPVFLIDDEDEYLMES